MRSTVPHILARIRATARTTPSLASQSFHSNTATSSVNFCTQARQWYASAPFRLQSLARSTRTGLRHSSNKPSPDVTSQLGSPQPKLGLQARLKKLFQQYGYVSVGVYLALSVADFPFCFLAVRLAGPERIGQLEHQILSSLEVVAGPVWNVVGPVVGPAVTQIKETIAQMRKGAANSAGLGGAADAVDSAIEGIKKPEVASLWTQLAIAYGIHKTLLIFVRVPLTAVLTPRVARILRSWGYRVGKGPAS